MAPHPERSQAFEPGDWVMVWAQVAVDQKFHPANVSVRLWSHNEDYLALVRREYVEVVDGGPADAPRCTHLLAHDGALVRCESHQGPGHGHHALDADVLWADAETAGYFEER